MAAASPSWTCVPTIMSGRGRGGVRALQNRLQTGDVSCERHLLSDTVRAIAKGRQRHAVGEERCERISERALGRRFTNRDTVEAVSQPLTDTAGIHGDCRHADRTGFETDEPERLGP